MAASICAPCLTSMHPAATCTDTLWSNQTECASHQKRAGVLRCCFGSLCPRRDWEKSLLPGRGKFRPILFHRLGTTEQA